MRPDIVLDRSGDLRHGLFWELVVGDPSILEFHHRDCPGGIYCPLYPSELELMETTGEEYVWARLGGRLRRKEYRNCSSNPEHITRVSFQNLSVDLSFGPRVPDLFHLDCGGEYSILVSPSLAVALEESGFKGFELHKLRFVPKPKIRNYRDIRELQFAGGRCLRPWSIDGHPNLCPWCGQTEVICQSCGQMSLPCSECEKYPWAASKNIKPGDKYLTRASPAAQRFTGLKITVC